MGDGSLIQSLFNTKGLVLLAVVLVVVTSCHLIQEYAGISVVEICHKIGRGFMTKVGQSISKREKRYHRDIEIGKIDEKMKTVKIYKFFKDLIIDLQLESTGITPYELLIFTIVGTFIASVVITLLFFTSFVMIIMIYPICFVATICMMYTRANIAHDRRISAVTEAENIICNNIKSGVVVAIRDNINIIPEEVRPYFHDFLDNIEVKNYHIKTALVELNTQLGSMADDFIKKCIVFELEEEHGIAEMFTDIVEMNNIKTDLRIEMKHELEEKINELRIGMAMIFAFLCGVLAIYPDVRGYYFNTLIGNVIIGLDLIAVIIIYVVCTVIRATEL